MPKPTYGEKKRLTEKEKYRILADAQYFVEYAKKLRSIPDQLDEETKISPETRAMLDFMANDLEKLNSVWKEYSTAYLDITKLNKDENEKERNNMIKLLEGLEKITSQMEAYQNEKNPVAERKEFAECYAAVKNIAGHYYEMTNGTLVVPEMTEEQKSKIITVKKEINIVSESSIKYMIKLADSEEVVGADMGYVDRFDAPLFSHEPTPDDIMQGKLGDCYFIAALCSVAANNPQIIRDMMKDNGDGTVTVRLYDEKKDGKLEPMYITVEKSVPVINLRKADGSQSVEDINANGTLWVQILEKAFAASNIHESSEEKFSETERSYSDIVSGSGPAAFRLLFGRQNVKNETINVRKNYSETDLPNVMDKLFKKIKENVVNGHFITAFSAGNYMDKKLLDEYDKELKEALTEQEKSGKTLAKEELQDLRKGVANKVFCGVVVLFDEETGVPKMPGHAYTLIDAYEKKGKKYVLVRNPHGRIGYEKGKVSTDSDKGYCEIPLDRFARMFPGIYTAKSLEPKYYLDFSSEYHKPLSRLYKGFMDSRSGIAKITLGLSLSRASRNLKNALEEIQNIQEQQFPSKYAMMNAYKELDKAAKAYLEKHKDDNLADMSDETNRRITIAKASMALAGSFLGHLEKERDVKADIHRIGRMMVTERGVFITQKVSNSEKVHPKAKSVFTDARVSKTLMPIDGDKLFDIAFEKNAHEIPGKVIDEVTKIMNEKQAKTTVQKEEVKETVNQTEIVI